jgi:DNA repair protein SbcC/Rad50
MIPLQLTIQGLYSYQEKQTIDFTRLTADGLFGIFGPVGCGKSSILEAITYALYGRTTRLNLNGDDRYYNMMNLKSDQLFIDFIFQAGKEQVQYKSVVKGKRSSKNFDDVKALDRNAYKKNSHDWEPVELTELEQSIGLSYDNFRRTIIIPQGQFQEFLQLSNAERTRMMKELFNLEKFEFFHKANALESKNNALKHNIEGQLNQLTEVDEESINLKQQQLNSLNEGLAQLQVKLAAQQVQAGEFKNLLTLTQDLQKTEQDIKQMQVKEPEFIQLEKTISDYELCVDQFKSLLQAYDDCANRQKKKVEQIKKDEDKLKALGVSIEKVQEQLENIKTDYEQRDLYKQQAEELGKLISIRDLQESILALQNRLMKGTNLLDDNKAAIETLKNEKADLEGKLKALKGSLPDMAELSDVKIWHTNRIHLEKNLQKIKSQIETEKILMQSLQKAADTVFSSPLYDMLPVGSEISAAQNYLMAKTDEINEQMHVLEQEGNELRVKEQLKKFAVELTEGKACPLCGSESHPHVYSMEDINYAFTAHQASVTEHRTRLKEINDMQMQLKELHVKMESGAARLKDFNGQLEKINAETDSHRTGFRWDRYHTMEALDQAYTAAGELRTDIQNHEATIEKTGKKLDQELRNRETWQAEIDKIRNLLTTNQTKSDTLMEQIVVIDLNQYKNSTTADLKAEIINLQDKCRRAEEQHKQLTNLLEVNLKEQNNIMGSLEALRNEHQQELKTQEQNTREIEKALKEFAYASVEEVRQILAQTIMLEQEKKKLSDFRHQQRLLEEKFMQLNIRINNQVYDPIAHQNLLSELEQNRKLSDDINQEVGKLTEMVKNLRHDFEKRIQLEKIHKTLELRAENIKTMKSLFKASGFVNYISSVYLQNLCSAANERFFQLTRQRLSLEINPDNSFQVRDFMNGGKIRSVKTLSGGQTFQAALSLALALADNIQKVTDSDQNFFFLDEGFGSLDKESLAIVFDTLKTLRKENRIVGVISHVEEMQQEIDANLRIEYQEELGSIIHPGWKG